MSYDSLIRSLTTKTQTDLSVQTKWYCRCAFLSQYPPTTAPFLSNKLGNMITISFLHMVFKEKSENLSNSFDTFNRVKLLMLADARITGTAKGRKDELLQRGWGWCLQVQLFLRNKNSAKYKTWVICPCLICCLFPPRHWSKTKTFKS